MLQWIMDVFWDERVWLPPGETWEDVVPKVGQATYANHWHVLLTMAMGLVLLVLRFSFDKYVFVPFGKSLGIKGGRSKAFPNNKLEDAYRGSMDSQKISALSKQLDMSERQIQRWMRLRLLQDKPSTLVKFCESIWRSIFLLCNCIFGVYVLWDKEWFWDIDQCYIGFPRQSITNDVWWYYTFSLAFYWSQSFSLHRDVRRKDHLQMVVHHAASLSLLLLGCICNGHRIGSLVLLVHDCSETLLEVTKAVKYAKYEKLSICMFIVFTVLWIVTRLVMFPYIIWSIPHRGELYVHPFPMAYVIFYLLCLLQALNVFWTWLILKVAYKVIKDGDTKGDIRSSSSELSDVSPYS